MRMLDPQAVTDARAWLDQHRADIPLEVRGDVAEQAAWSAAFTKRAPAPPEEVEQ